jgi:hypothetical protein
MVATWHHVVSEAQRHVLCGWVRVTIAVAIFSFFLKNQLD